MTNAALILAGKLKTGIRPIYKPNPIYGYCMHTLADTAKAIEAIQYRFSVKVDEGFGKLTEFYSGRNDIPEV